MARIFEVFIETIYWILIFLSPFFGSVLIAAIVYFSIAEIIWLPIIIIFIGIIVGIVFAERIRKKYGCSHYIGKILATPEIWPDEPTNPNTPKSD